MSAIFGLILAIGASVLFGIAIAIQKYSVSSLKKFSFAKMAKNKIWISSLLITVVGLLMYLASLSYTPISTIQPLTSISIIIPIIAGVVVFKEKVGGLKWALLGVLVVGIILVSVF